MCNEKGKKRWPPLASPSGSDGKKKKITCNAGDPGSIPGLGRFPGGGNGYPLQYSSLENSMETGVRRLSSQRVRPEDVME